MIIKKFQAKTEAEAMNMAKKEIGESLVVMNVRNVNKKGIFSFLFTPMIEVTVAKEEEVDLPPTEKLKSSLPEKQATIDMKADEDTTPKPSFSIFTPDIIARSEASMNASRVTKGQDSEDMRLKSKEDEGIEKKQTEDKNVLSDNAKTLEKLDNLQEMLESRLQKEVHETDHESTDENLSENMKFMKLLYNTMIDNEVDEKYANQIVEELDKNNIKNKPMDFILSNIYQKLILKFGNPTGITPENNGTKVIFFVGPTGVGKTTTIAKIASKFSVNEKKKIALITADTYRIAAAEQLRTYANILDAPFRVIYGKEELGQAIRDYSFCDYILVDTAGHSHKNKEQRDAMVSLIHELPEEQEKEVFLVLSATTKYRDLINIADAYKEMTSFKLIFTKLDETTTFGNLLNVRLHTDAQLAYVTCGQNVPEDIENFNPQKIVKTLLDGRHEQ